MRTSFTPREVAEITAKDLATLQTEYAGDGDNPWIKQVTAITQDLHSLASDPNRDSAAVEELEKRISVFLAEDKRNKGMTPSLYMARSLRAGDTSNI